MYYAEAYHDWPDRIIPDLGEMWNVVDQAVCQLIQQRPPKIQKT